MCTSVRYFIYFCIVLNVVPYVFSIKCWNCRSSNDPKCADPFDNSTVPITDCKQEKGLSHLPGVRPSMCRKIRQKGCLNNTNLTSERTDFYSMGQCRTCVIDPLNLIDQLKVNGEWRYFRDCAYLGDVGIQGDERFCLMRTGTYNIFIEYCTCNSKDGCNSSSMFSPLPLFVFILSSVFLKWIS